MKIEVSKYDGGWFFKIISPDDEELARSKMYVYRSECISKAEQVAFDGQWTIEVKHEDSDGL